MRLIISILFAGVFTLFGLLRLEGYFDLGTVNLVNQDGTFDTNLSFIKNSFNYIYYLPDLLFEFSETYITSQAKEYIQLSSRNTYIFVVFMYHFINIFVISQILRVFVTHRQRRYAIITIIILYLVLISIIQNTIAFFA